MSRLCRARLAGPFPFLVDQLAQSSAANLAVMKDGPASKTKKKVISSHIGFESEVVEHISEVP